MACAKGGKIVTISIALTIKVLSRVVLSKADVKNSELILVAKQYYVNQIWLYCNLNHCSVNAHLYINRKLLLGSWGLRLCKLWLISRESGKLKHSCEGCKKRSIKIALVQQDLQRLRFSTVTLWLFHVQHKWVNSLWQSQKAQSILPLQCPEAAKWVSKPTWLGVLLPPAKGVQHSHLDITKD